jgi:hypothetical protein
MRLKIIAGNLLALLVVGLASFFFVRSELQTALEGEVDAQIGNDGTLFDRSWRLSGRDFLDRVTERSQTQPVRDSFGGLDDDSRRRRAHEAANGVAEWFRDPTRGRGGLPEIVAIADETGRVLARNQDPNRMVGVQLGSEIASVRQVLGDGTPRHDVWNYAGENKLLEIGAAPIRNAQGGIIGVLVVGYELSNGIAASEGQILGRDVAFITNDRVYSASLQQDVSAALQGFLFSGRAAQTTAALTGTAPDQWATNLGESQWVGVTAQLPLSPGANVGYVVLANKTERMELVASTNMILYLLAVGVLLVRVYGFLVGGSFVKALEDIEEAVLAVINGKTETRIALEGGELGGLAYRINQLINVFTGVSESDDEGRVEAGGAQWRDAAFAEPGQAGAGGAGGAGGGGGAAGEPIDDPAVAAQVAAEPEEAYYARIYAEYAAAKQAIGENVGNIPQDKFAARLKGNGDNLAKKHGVRAVRFQVETRDNQVSLRPVLIR